MNMSPNGNSKELYWAGILIGVGVTAAAHPVGYVKVLIQIGHEPIDPKPGKTWLGKSVLVLPGLYEYISYIKSRDGFCGLYRGLSTRMCGSLLHGVVTNKVLEKLKQNYGFEEETDSSDLDPTLFMKRISMETIAKCAGVVASQPFHVMMIRTMAQFVGEEVKYVGIVASIKEVYRHDGVWGFFNGLIPRMLGEVFTLWLSSILAYLINSYLIEDKDLRNYTSATMGFLASAITYPFSLVASIMAVNNSGLLAAEPPNMAVYVNWLDCWSHLNSQNQLKRGSSILWRYYTGSIILIDSKPVAAKTIFKQK